MSTPDAQKADLRRHYLEERRRLDTAAWRGMSNAIVEQLQAFPPYRQCSVLLTYVSAKDNEVDTHLLIDKALDAGKTVLVPVMGAERGALTWSRLTGRDELVRARFGLFELAPPYQHVIDAPSTALCIVPGIAFTRAGDRIGYGGGYYDRFLGVFQGMSIGLAFDLQLAATLPVAPWDQRVTCVMTNTARYEGPL